MVYNADDRDSYERLMTIHNDFKESNQVGGYQVLVSVITNNIIQKKTPKLVKKEEVRQFINSKGIPSYIEITMDTKRNVNILD
jgi:hypothetical protein